MTNKIARRFSTEQKLRRRSCKFAAEFKYMYTSGKTAVIIKADKKQQKRGPL